MTAGGTWARLVTVGLLVASCTSSVYDDPGTGPVGALLERCPTPVEPVGEAVVNVSISNQTVLDTDPVVVAVTIDGATVACEAVAGSEDEDYVDFPIEVGPEPHTVVVEAWWDSDVDEGGFEVTRFFTSRLLDPAVTPHLVVHRRHVPPEAATIDVQVSERPPNA